MKLKICNLLKVTTYLELAIATFILSWFLYHSSQYSNFAPDNFVLLTFVAGASLQIIYSFAIIRLMHYYAPEQKVPGKSFTVFFLIATILNILVAAALTFLFLLGLKQSMFQNGVIAAPSPDDMVVLSIIGPYAIVSIYTVAGSAKLKKAILKYQSLKMEMWLEDLNNTIAA